MMIQRCKNPNYDAFPDYGGKGITVCDEWCNFINFYEDMGERPLNKSLDRKDPSGNYCKENCRWSDSLVQAINKNKRVDNVSGYKGVSWDTSKQRWRAALDINGKRKLDKIFKYKEDAIQARKEAEEKYFKPLLEDTENA